MVNELKIEVKTTGNIVNDLAALFKQINNSGLDLSCIKLIQQLITLKDANFGEQQANWILQNHNKIINLLDTKNGEIVFRALAKTKGEKSISKIILEARVHRKFFYNNLDILTKLGLFQVNEFDNYKPGQKKEITINDDFKVIIDALRLYKA